MPSRERLILASASPRRLRLLREAGYDLEVVPAAVSEEVPAGLPPERIARCLALRKALEVAGRRADKRLVLGADTLIDHAGRPVGKPEDLRDAGRILARLAGREHRVVTGVALVEARTGRHAVGHAVTRVRFRPLTAEEIDAYLASGEPLGKAGAYAIQGQGAALVERTEGSWSNVVGLPLELLGGMLDSFGRDGGSGR